ncbi:MAG TPA: XdhC family protein [Blastocatellia bacterium]|nr:XdhC family protein [Blastocatellia bacterium]
MDIEVLRAVAEMHGRGERVALATVVSTRGSVPRRAGSKMAVSEHGRTVGTVGGGCGEADVVTAMWETLRDGESREVLVDLTEDLEADGELTESPAICGGTMRVFVELLAAD